MADYKSLAASGQRHAQLEKARQQMLSDFESQRQQITKDNQVRIGADKFVTQTDSVETQLKHSTVGLVKLEDFQRIRGELEEDKARRAAKTLAAGNVKPKKSKTKKKKVLHTLSFAAEEDDEEGDDGGATAVSKPLASTTSVDIDSEVTPGSIGKGDTTKVERRPKKVKFSKNPDVDTSFLPDREREEQERQIREKLRQEWLQEQERIKNETITITYSYWDGSGHRRVVKCKKGDTISDFLEKCRQQFNELNTATVDNMMYIKEDLIIPHHYSFYDFIINKSRGKSGPLFDFDVREDIRLINDASVEKDESHAGKVCLRTWYDRHKHIFPASRWELYDSRKDYGSYTIKDTRKG